MNRSPAFQFYTGDWIKDPELSRCSKAAKGVWIDALCLLWDMPFRGVFGGFSGEKSGEKNEKQDEKTLIPWSKRDIAYAVGGDIKENLKCLKELLDKGVARIGDDGAIHCARMVRDESKRLKGSERLKEWRFKHGQESSSNENETLHETQNELPLKRSRNAPCNASEIEKPHAASSSSSSSVQDQELSSNPPDCDAPPNFSLSSEEGKSFSKSKEETAAVYEVFLYYLNAVSRSPKLYAFTRLRKQKGTTCLHECLKRTGGNLEKAKQLMIVCVDELAASDWHMGRHEKTKGQRYIDWETHLFGSVEKMERWWDRRQDQEQKNTGGKL